MRPSGPWTELTGYTIPRLAKAADISNWLRVFVSSLSKYRNVLSNCSSCAGVRLVMFLDTICMQCQTAPEKGREKNSNLVIEECNLLQDVLDDQLEFKPEVLTSEYRVIVFIDIGIAASRFCFGNLLQDI